MKKDYKPLLKSSKGRKWGDLDDKEKEEWGEFTDDNQKALCGWANLTQIKKCGQCKKFNEPLIKPMPYDYKASLSDRINIDFVWHQYSVHGFPPEQLMKNIGDMLGIKLIWKE